MAVAFGAAIVFFTATHVVAAAAAAAVFEALLVRVVVWVLFPGCCILAPCWSVLWLMGAAVSLMVL